MGPAAFEDLALLRMSYRLARRAHAVQIDKAGRPYLSHVVGVARAVLLAGGTAEEIAAALLHDVIEDGHFATMELLDVGVPAAVVKMVGDVTRLPGERYTDFIERVVRCGRIGSARVKLADVCNNLHPARTAHFSGGDLSSLAARYARALTSLASATGGDWLGAIDQANRQVFAAYFAASDCKPANIGDDSA